MSLRETLRRKQRAITDFWKVVKSIPGRLEQCEAHLDAVRRAIDPAYKQRCEGQERLEHLMRRQEIDMFAAGGSVDGTPPAFDGLQRHINVTPSRHGKTHAADVKFSKDYQTSQERLRHLVATMHAKPVTPIRAPDGWHPGNEDDDED